MDWNLGNNKIQDIQQPVKYETDSDNELKVTKKVTLKKFVAGHAWRGREDQYEIITQWCFWMYVLNGAVSRRNSAKLGNYKIPVKLRET